MFDNLICSIKGNGLADSESCQEDGDPPSTCSPPLIINVNSSNSFESILASPHPVLLQCWAPWSDLSRKVKSTVASLADEFQDQIQVAQLNADENRALLDRLHISKVPTTIIFKEGQEVIRVVGDPHKGSLRSKLGGII